MKIMSQMASLLISQPNVYIHILLDIASLNSHLWTLWIFMVGNFFFFFFFWSCRVQRNLQLQTFFLSLAQLFFLGETKKSSVRNGILAFPQKKFPTFFFRGVKNMAVRNDPKFTKTCIVIFDFKFINVYEGYIATLSSDK